MIKSSIYRAPPVYVLKMDSDYMQFLIDIVRNYTPQEADREITYRLLEELESIL